MRSGKITGQHESKIHIDTGSSVSMVQRKFVPVLADIRNFVAMRNTTGTQRYPMAEVRVELDGLSYQQKMAVSEQLEEDALLGLDIDLWHHMIKAMKKEEVNRIRKLIQNEEEAKSYAVSTRAQGKQQLEQKDQENGKDRKKKEERRENLSLGEQFPFHDSIFAFKEKGKQYKSRAQRREQKKAQGEGLSFPRLAVPRRT